MYGNNSVFANVISDNMFHSLGVPWFSGERVVQHPGYRPSAAIAENEGGYTLTMDLPGVSKDDVKIQLHKNVLTISGTRSFSRNEKDQLVHSEIPAGNFERSFRMTQSIDSEHIKTDLSNGVLTITLPKHENAKPREIKIQ